MMDEAVPRSGALSEGEKAATFIGFVPETCENKVDGPNRQCWKCNRTHRYAPDMNKPENYMRAVDALTAKYGALRIVLTRNAVGIATPGFDYDIHENTWTEALAALYDAQSTTANPKGD